ncbi:hypothetical protein JDV02_010590 [Purpureocillium takamizusanense]|uniref:Myb-like domain-containing protein n=1 Tax=Purpureocillium takamizusanense TaxID=2060973 RepID=A0A9Q8QU33_9HYPO|nr:uncharacterized protein JDV02_010590 [Purpureocillium takamizusanense]UNI24871.1 hypothetical protein JDV02_010590 [Purpureocillium takamizusanense]
MPKHSRSASGHPSHYAQMASSGLPSPLYGQQRVPIPASYYTIPGAPPPSSSSSMSQQQLASQQQQPQSQASYDAAIAAAAVAASSYATTADPSTAAGTTTTTTITAIPPGQHRPSSGAWSPQDDNQLVAARMQGLNWGQIKDTHFPAKTANACRKRHERLMERKGADDWDGRKLQRLAKEYMGMRREIWSGLAARTGEKWNVVEQKCMSNGLKNLQSAARAASRRDRLETGGGGGSAHSVTGYDDDSGISGIGLTPVDELDAPYGSPDATTATSSSSASSYGGLTPSHYLQHAHAHAAQQQQQQHHQQQQQQHAHHHQHHHQHHQHHHQHRHAQHAHQQYQQHLQPSSYGAGVSVSTYAPAAYGHGYSSSVSSTASRAPRYGTSEGSSPYMDAERLSGDMGIGAVMNHRSGGRG